MSATNVEPAAWKTVVTDSLGLVLVIWSIPVAVIVIGAPVALLVNLLVSSIGWLR